MPRTNKATEPMRRTSGEPARANGLVNEVLTLAEAADYLRLGETDVLQLVQEQGLPARQLGPEWRFLKSAIQDWLGAGPAPRSNKQAWMALAGVWKNDPFQEEMRKEISPAKTGTSPVLLSAEAGATITEPPED
jgi:excisionase family DNA binding protein